MKSDELAELKRRAMRHGNTVRRSTEDRDACIRELRAAGQTFREIGEVVGMSHTAVSYVCRGRVATD